MQNNSSMPPRDYRGTMLIAGSLLDQKVGRRIIFHQRKVKESRSGRSCQGGKRQTAIKNDPGFAGAVVMTTTETRANRNRMEQRTLQIQAGHHPLHLMSPRKTLEEDFEQVIDRVSPHPACRTVCAAQDYTNCRHALNYKTKLFKAAGIL